MTLWLQDLMVGEHTQETDVTNNGGAVNVKGLQDRVEDGVKRGLQLRAGQERADTLRAGRLTLSDVRDSGSRDHGGGEGQDGENGELHFVNGWLFF